MKQEVRIRSQDMKRIVLICFCILVSSITIGQVKTVDSGSDTTYNYFRNFANSKAGLIDLQKSDLKSCYRFWRDGQIIEIWSDDNVIYHGNLINYIYKVGRNYKRTVIFKKQDIDSDKAAKVINKFISNSINTIPSDSKISGWETGLDGESLIIEFSTPTTYSSKSYWEPNDQKSIEGVTVSRFYTALKDILDLKGKYESYRKSLPDGRYGIGITMTVKTRYWPRMKPKGGSALF